MIGWLILALQVLVLGVQLYAVRPRRDRVTSDWLRIGPFRMHRHERQLSAGWDHGR